ncbi:MAG: RNA polymerase sigma factor [Deltaproteobacteria bacterium]|nr:RNA polymerase sigma factor [Deltaproteobacteria bacterium]
MPEESDESLMARYAGGDAAAFDTLFRRYAARIRAFFSRSFNNSAICDDLLQTTFLKLHHGRENFDSAQPFRPWIYTLATRVSIDELRRQYRSRAQGETSLDTLTPLEEPRDSASAETFELRRRVRRALESLPEAQRTVVLLHRFEGMTFSEIAGILTTVEGRDVHEGAVRVRAFRAYATLRSELIEVIERAGVAQ